MVDLTNGSGITCSCRQGLGGGAGTLSHCCVWELVVVAVAAERAVVAMTTLLLLLHLLLLLLREVELRLL